MCDNSLTNSANSEKKKVRLLRIQTFVLLVEIVYYGISKQSRFLRSTCSKDAPGGVLSQSLETSRRNSLMCFYWLPVKYTLPDSNGSDMSVTSYKQKATRGIGN